MLGAGAKSSKQFITLGISEKLISLSLRHKLESWTQTEIHFAHVPCSNCSDFHPAPEQQKLGYINTPELCRYLQPSSLSSQLSDVMGIKVSVQSNTFSSPSPTRRAGPQLQMKSKGVLPVLQAGQLLCWLGHQHYQDCLSILHHRNSAICKQNITTILYERHLWTGDQGNINL